MSSFPPVPSVRARNLRLIAELVQTGRATTRAALARLTGLSRTAVSSLVSELLGRGLLVEPASSALSPDAAARSGRPAVELSVNPEAGALIGIHLAHDGVRIALGDVTTRVLAEAERPLDVDHEPADTLEYAARAAMELVRAGRLDPERILGIGVAVAAPVTVATHALSSTTVLRDWAGVDIAARLHERTGLPIRVGNDANLGALAEWRLGAGRGIDDLAYVMLSDGVGAGLILGGRLYEGGDGGAGELGHVTVQPEGRVCRCGNRGCLETLVSTRALVEALNHTGARAGGTSDLIALAERDHPGAQRVLIDAGRAVGQALAAVCMTLDPRRVILGGKTAAASGPLMHGIHDALALALPPQNRRALDVVEGRLGDRAELLGALTIAGTDAVGRMLDTGRDATAGGSS